MLELSRIHKLFHVGTPDERVAVDGVDLALKRGDFAVIVGGNGAGKSTLLNILAGDVVPDSGTIRIDGSDVTPLATYQRAKYISRVFQDPSIGTAAALSIEENLAVAMRRGERRGFGRGITAAMSRDFRERLASFGLGLEDRLAAPVGLLSGGQRQALSLLMAVLHEPKLLLLDEHTAALDPRTAEMVMRVTASVVRSTGVTTLMVTHNMHHAIAYGDRLVMMQQGRIVSDLSGEHKRGLTAERLVASFDENPTALAQVAA